MKRFEQFLADVFGIVFIGLAAVVGVETLLRKFFGVSIQGADELAGYALAVGATVGFALAVTGRNHIRVDVFHEFFPRWLQALLNWLSSLLLGALALLFAVLCAQVLTKSIEYGSTAQTPWATPMIYPQSVWYVALLLFAAYALGYAIRATWLLAAGKIDRLNEEFHPKSAKEELKEELDDLAQRQALEPTERA
jgi:TRAP-type C4-dicarboxylate transport system permease small subunit